MSQRARTTLTFSVKFPLPPGATQVDAQGFIMAAFREQKRMALANEQTMAGVQVEEISIKLAHRETHYL